MSRLLNNMRLKFIPKLFNNKVHIPKMKLMLYSSASALAATGFCISSLSLNNTTMAAAEYGQVQSRSVEQHFHLLEMLGELAPIIDAPTMLTAFLNELKTSSNGSDPLFSSEFVRGLFMDSGIVDEELIKHLIDIMDWNKNGKLTKYEVAALFTLFNVGTDVERYKFLFNCLDLDQSGSVYKDEFREILTCLLEAKYHIYGLENQ
eukprot:UN09053